MVDKQRSRSVQHSLLKDWTSQHYGRLTSASVHDHVLQLFSKQVFLVSSAVSGILFALLTLALINNLDKLL